MIAPIHAKATPAILATQGEVDAWLAAETAHPLALQRPLPDGGLKILVSGETA
jgi:hypothetical protein